MTDYRQKAIADVAEATDQPENIVRNACSYATSYAVAQREARLRERAALRNLINKLDNTIPYINGAFSIAYSKTSCYTGPTFSGELEDARAEATIAETARKIGHIVEMPELLGREPVTDALLGILAELTKIDAGKVTRKEP